MKYDEAYRLARKALAEHWAHDPPPLDLSKRVSIDAIGRGDAWAMYVRLWPSWAALPRDLTDAESREQGITLCLIIVRDDGVEVEDAIHGEHWDSLLARSG